MLSEVGFAAYANSGWMVLNVGGNWNNRSNDGLFSFNADYSASNRNSNIGGRLLVALTLYSRRPLLTAW